MSVREGADSTMGLRDGDGMADATEGVVASIAAAGGNDGLTGLTANWRQYGT